MLHAHHIQLVLCFLDECTVTSVYWFPTGFDLVMKAINRCDGAIISLEEGLSLLSSGLRASVRMTKQDCCAVYG